MAEIELGNLYQFNKQLSSQMPVLTEPEIGQRWGKLRTWFDKSIDRFAMLLCHEQRDFTLFFNNTQDIDAPNRLTNDLFDCLKHRGQIVSIDRADGDAWEIWLRMDNSIIEGIEEVDDYCYFLFNYDLGVIEV